MVVLRRAARMTGEKLVALIGKIAGQGLTPHQLALTVAIGVAVGILPIPWGATPLCALIAFALRLNQTAIQGANYLTYPLQIALFVPFYTLGARLFPRGPATFSELPVALVATLKALGAWLLIAPALAVLLYLLLLPVAKRRGARFDSATLPMRTE